MPKILAPGHIIEYLRGVILRKILLQNGIDLYNSDANVINYRIIDSCSVAVLVRGDIKEGKFTQSRAVLPTSSFSYKQLRF